MPDSRPIRLKGLRGKLLWRFLFRGRVGPHKNPRETPGRFPVSGLIAGRAERVNGIGALTAIKGAGKEKSAEKENRTVNAAKDRPNKFRGHAGSGTEPSKPVAARQGGIAESLVLHC